MTSWTDYQDDISDAISDSMDVDWSASVGARAVVAWLNEHRPLVADTTRVTVPIEDLAGKLKAIRDKFLMPTPDKDFTDYAIMTRCVERLSAAPAPEGVTVSLREALDDALKFISDMGIDLHHARVADWYEEGANNAALQMSEDMRLAGNRCADYEPLATREEAPAEAGEPMTDAEVRQWIEACNHEPARQVLREYLALRAQPQAREDAQPVAEIVLFGGDLKEVAWAKGKMPPVGAKLYTHPAPDALREAVEALEPFAMAARGLSSRWGDHETHWQGATSPIAVEDLRRADKASAALQAEQGAK